LRAEALAWTVRLWTLMEPDTGGQAIYEMRKGAKQHWVIDKLITFVCATERLLQSPNIKDMLPVDTKTKLI
jgi:hypothetical protein